MANRIRTRDWSASPVGHAAHWPAALRSFNALNQGFSLIDVQFDEHGNAVDAIIRDANPAQDRSTAFARSPDGASGNCCRTSRAAGSSRDGAVARTGEPAHFEDWSEKNQRWYEVEAARVGVAGSSLVALIYNDTTERKRIEEDLRLREAWLTAQKDAFQGPQTLSSFGEALTPQEEEVLRLVASSFSNPRIAEHMRLDPADVVPLKEAAMRKAGLLTRIQVLRYAQSRGWMANGNHASPAGPGNGR